LGINVEFGLRKLSWGKADSSSVLDVINTMDYSTMLNMGDADSMKIANAMLHLSYPFGGFSKLEFVYVPTFEPWHFATSGRWAQKAVSGMTAQFSPLMTMLGQAAGTLLQQGQTDLANAFLIIGGPGFPLAYAAAQAKIAQGQQVLAASTAYLENLTSSMANLGPDTTTLKYGQVGLRFTTTTGPLDWGMQYYYGYKPQPAFDIKSMMASIGNPLAPGPVLQGLTAATTAEQATSALDKLVLPLVYNPYHQAGFDAAMALGPVNMRAEAAANITYDLKGDDPAVYNPNLAFSLGADYTIPVINVMANAQVNETLILFHDKIDHSATSVDTEAGSDLTSTRITLNLSRNFIQDQLVVECSGVYEVEQKDFLIMPKVSWTDGGFSMGLGAGFLLGDADGQFGQYKDNSYIKFTLGYQF
jgi:hypothetical protein